MEMKASTCTISEVRESCDLAANARRIDAAIRRAVRKERERCAKILRKYTTNDTVCWLLTQHFKSECEP